ncbi:zinc finger protein 839 [Emydura macquarii macquarii]|uniref:zinc finger protein 839 n=1 Tax=Emydura macquarii macquarii TaxID=1129001 RepID=UPI003529FEB6
MAAPEEGGGESAAAPSPPAEEEPPGPAAARGALLSAAAGEGVGLLGPGFALGAAVARGDLLCPLEAEEGEGLLAPLEAGPPTEEGSEVLAVTEELAQSLAASPSAVGTTLYLQQGGSLVQGSGLSAEEQRRRLEQLVAVTESQAVGLRGKLPAEQSQAELLAQPPGQQTTATPLAPEELQRVIEQVSRAQKQPPPPPPSPSGTSIGSLLLPPPRGGGYPLSQEIGLLPPASGFSGSGSPQGCTLSAASGSQPVTSIMHNASQQLQNVAQQVALQQGKAIGTTRCLVHKQLEAICVQVQPGQMKENEKPVSPLAAVQSKAITQSQPSGRNSGLSGLNIINPQIIRIQPVTGTEQQQFFLHSSSEPAVQLLVQRPLAPPGQNKIPTHQTLNGQTTTCARVPATESRNVTLVAASSANTLISSLEKKQKEELKLKKSLKVKTRSGRISRPPKYKAKDYKFIKTEDLADGHQSDSDDYSELSIEDDDEGKSKGTDALFNPLNYNLKPKMFRCQTCEKSYIGKGGLARHYKLNPGHGQLESSQQKVSMNKTNGSAYLDILGGGGGETVSLTHSQPVAVTLSNENSLAIGLEETASSQNEQQPDKSAEGKHLLAAQQSEIGLVHCGPGMPKGPGRPRRPKRRGRPRMAGRSMCSGRLNRLGQSPSKLLSNMSTEHIVFRRKARLKELIQQCDNEDLMELALPRLTKLVTVYEFLLMKVEKGYPTKAFFPDVYREFEELHNMVKKMSQDYFSNSDFLSYQQPMEIKNPQVAESLGITENLLRKQEIQAADSFPQCVIKTVGEQMFAEISGKKRANENSDEELLASSKRTKVEGILENVKDVYFSQNGVEEKSWNLSTLITKDGFNPLNGAVLSEDRGITPCTAGSTKHTGEQHKLLDLKARINSANSDIFQSMKMRMECSQPVSIRGPDNTGNTSPLCTDALLHAEADSSPEEFVQAHFISENTAGRLTTSEFCNCMVSEDVMDNQSTNLSMSEETDHNGKYQKLQQDEENQSYAITNEQPEQLNDADIADQMQQLEKVFSTSMVPVDHPYKTQTDSQRNPVQETSLSIRVNLESPIKNLNEFSCGIEEQHAVQHELENAVTGGETVAFEIADESHEFLSQGHEQILIQTADGLILSHPGTAVLSQAEGIVIVTNADGTTMHIRTPEGVSLETVEALLAMEADGQSEDILLSQSEVEP